MGFISFENPNVSIYYILSQITTMETSGISSINGTSLKQWNRNMMEKREMVGGIKHLFCTMIALLAETSGYYSERLLLNS